MKKPCPWHRFDDELGAERRMLWFISTVDNKTVEGEEAAGLEGAEARAKAAIEEFEGKTPDQAREQVDDEVNLRNDKIQSQLSVYDSRLTSFINKIAFGKISKYALDNIVTQAAKSRVEGVRAELEIDLDFREVHTTSSLSILGAKRTITEDLIVNLGTEILSLGKRLKRNQEDRKSLGFFKRTTMLPFSNDLEKRIKNIQRMKLDAEAIRKKTFKKQKKMETGMKTAKKFDQRIREVIIDRDPTLAGEVDAIIRDSVLSGKTETFNTFIDEHSKRLELSAVEVTTCKDFVSYLIEGSQMPNLMAKGLGYPTAADIQDYFISKQVERGILNRDTDSTAERIKRLKQFPLGQEIELSEFGSFFCGKRSNF